MIKLIFATIVGLCLSGCAFGIDTQPVYYGYGYYPGPNYVWVGGPGGAWVHRPGTYYVPRHYAPYHYGYRGMPHQGFGGHRR